MCWSAAVQVQVGVLGATDTGCIGCVIAWARTIRAPGPWDIMQAGQGQGVAACL